MLGAIPPLPHTSSWSGVQLKERKNMDNFTLLCFTLLYFTCSVTKAINKAIDNLK
jgi:hypothetical protein